MQGKILVHPNIYIRLYNNRLQGIEALLSAFKEPYKMANKGYITYSFEEKVYILYKIT